MINKDSSGELIAPRRRVEHEPPASDPQIGGGVPVISRLPSLDWAATSGERVARGPQTPVDVESRPVEDGEAEPEGVSGVQRVEAKLPAKDSLFTTITNYPWSHLLLGLGLAGLVWLAMSAVTRRQTAVIGPPTPPTVQYHITPPPQQEGMIVAPSPSAVESDEITSRVARRLDEPSNASTTRSNSASIVLPAEIPDGIVLPAEIPDGDGSLTPSDDGSSQNTVGYPSTEFPELPLPSPPAKRDTAKSGVRLSGDIQKFKN